MDVKNIDTSIYKKYNHNYTKNNNMCLILDIYDTNTFNLINRFNFDDADEFSIIKNKIFI